MAFSALGYDAAYHGHSQWNGVAILSRVGIDDVTTGFDTEVVDPYEGDARLLAATCGGVRVVSTYVPNGREVGTEFYERKLVWLERLHDWLQASASSFPDLAILGDFNVAPEDRDVHDPALWAGKVLCSQPERDAMRQVSDWGLIDVFRQHHADAGLYSWWDYRAGAFPRNHGLRIDHLWATTPLAAKCVDAWIDKAPRALPRASDHVPVVAEFAI
jgi:exodeoxyribonuclease-3